MHRKFAALVVATVMLAAVTPAAEAQQPAKVPKIGWLSAPVPDPGRASGTELFRREFT